MRISPAPAPGPKRAFLTRTRPIIGFSHPHPVHNRFFSPAPRAKSGPPGECTYPSCGVATAPANTLKAPPKSAQRNMLRADDDMNIETARRREQTASIYTLSMFSWCPLFCKIYHTKSALRNPALSHCPPKAFHARVKITRPYNAVDATKI